jgi:hypothetical protein
LSAGAAIDALLGGFERAARAFEAGDAIAASAELAGADAACAALAAAGVQLDAPTLAEARRRWLACETAAAVARRSLAAELQSTGTARRAAAAYGG